MMANLKDRDKKIKFIKKYNIKPDTVFDKELADKARLEIGYSKLTITIDIQSSLTGLSRTI